jgi:hypothetical protein
MCGLGKHIPKSETHETISVPNYDIEILIMYALGVS